MTRITLDPDVMCGKPCIRGLRITVGTLVGLVAAGRTIPEILARHNRVRRALFSLRRGLESGPSQKRASTAVATMRPETETAER